VTTITRRFEWDAAHRVLGHEGKCRYLHGHRYRADVEVSSPSLDGIGRVIDYSVLKEVVGGWIDQWWDHNAILHNDDPLLKHGEVFDGRPPWVMGANPTAENLARALFEQAEEMLVEKGLTVQSVRVYETPNCWADYCEGKL